jgi:hypothetical protein
VSSEEAETTAKQQAKEILLGLIEEGVADAYCNHYQSCAYIYDIVRHVAEEGTTLSAQDFARNLLDDWSK